MAQSRKNARDKSIRSFDMRILKLDPSLLKYFVCSRKVYLTSILRYSSGLPSQSIHIGSAFHLFASELAKGTDKFKATQMAIEYFNTRPYVLDRRNQWKDAGYLFAMCNGFELPFRPIFNDAIEMRLALPFLKEEDCELLLCGTMDLLAEDEDGLIMVDYKTTASWNHAEFFSGYRLDIQFPFYQIILRRSLEFAAQKDGECARLLEVLMTKGIRTIVHGIFLKKDDAPVHKSSAPIFYNAAFLEEIEHMIVNASHKMLELFRGPMPPREGIYTGGCHNKFGACPFEKACLSDNPHEELNLWFSQQEYDPLTFGE